MSVQSKCTAAKKKRIQNLYGGRCAYCGCFPDQITFDHLKAVARGGKDATKNLIPACIDCNNAKGSMRLERFRRAILERLEGPPRRYNRHWAAILTRFTKPVRFFFETIQSKVVVEANPCKAVDISALTTGEVLNKALAMAAGWDLPPDSYVSMAGWGFAKLD